MTEEKKEKKDNLEQFTDTQKEDFRKITQALRIPQAPPPITPVGWSGLTPSRPPKTDPPKEPFVYITGTELMKRWSVGWEAIFDWARQETLTPYEPELQYLRRRVKYDFGMLSDYSPKDREEYFSKWLYYPNDVEAFKAQHGKILDGWREKVTPSKSEKKEDYEAENYFYQIGDIWEIGFKGKGPFPLQHCPGLSIIAFLLKRPLEIFHVNDLSKRFKLGKSNPESNELEETQPEFQKEDGGEIDYDEEGEATDRKFYDEGLRISQNVVPKRGKQPIEYSEEEKIADRNRKNILNHLERAYTNIGKYLPHLVYFLKTHKHIKTGFKLTYHPPVSPPISWKIITQENIS